MNKKKLSKFSLAAFAVLAAIALLLIFSAEAENPKTKIALIGFVVLMLYGCYRSFVHINDSDNSSEANKIVDKLMKKRTIQGFFAVIFNPLDTRFRTILSLYIILLVKLYCNATLTNSTIVVFIIAKCCMFRVYYNLWKKIQDALAMDNISNETDEEIDEQLIENMKKLADCKCTYYPPTSGNEFMRHYNSAIARGKKEGFMPLLVYVNDILYTAISSEFGMEDENKIDIQTIRSTRKKLIAEASAEEGKKWLQKELKDLKDDSYNEILGEPVNDQQGMKELSIFSQEKTPPMLIVEVPVKEPWQVIAWFPFGNWNACPEKKDLVNVCKYWYEKYGAVPSLITYDTLEMTVSKPVSNNQSLELAEEQYAFCTDIVSQGVGYVNTLADCLRKSTIWYFWWD